MLQLGKGSNVEAGVRGRLRGTCDHFRKRERVHPWWQAQLRGKEERQGGEVGVACCGEGKHEHGGVGNVLVKLGTQRCYSPVMVSARERERERLTGGSSGPHARLSGGERIQKYAFAFGRCFQESGFGEDRVGLKAVVGWAMATVLARSARRDLELIFDFRKLQK